MNEAADVRLQRNQYEDFSINTFKAGLMSLALAATASLMPAVASAAPKGKILVVMSSAHELELRDGIRWALGDDWDMLDT